MKYVFLWLIFKLVIIKKPDINPIYNVNHYMEHLLNIENLLRKNYLNLPVLCHEIGSMYCLKIYLAYTSYVTFQRQTHILPYNQISLTYINMW